MSRPLTHQPRASEENVGAEVIRAKEKKIALTSHRLFGKGDACLRHISCMRTHITESQPYGSLAHNRWNSIPISEPTALGRVNSTADSILDFGEKWEKATTFA